MWHLLCLTVVLPAAHGHMNQPQQAFGVPQQQYGAPVHQVPPQHLQQQQQYPPQQPMQLGHQAPQAGNLLRDKAQVQDRAHIQEHLQEILGDQDLSKMSEDELQFHYFKLHDNDDNNRLDGLELVKSLIHWHVEEHKHLQNAGHATTKIFNDVELQQMIDPILQMDDTNRDGYIDYPEFVAAQKQRGF
ncbi:multiple coagulation factor deficiency protein 2 homolog isoform X2 [Galendromus occidentalis]|uniref:Multiple coagulation factor deficiency protein 2 homolog isoform X2 n=1 Tax=Galendromus occidentalis TaxID=34638 RepID=A0AAJ7PA43_9ACAR|nr:multiple coagulation factor deficiency protein 2 homolog isoform X2 [Galendromus occidentalis]